MSNQIYNQKSLFRSFLFSFILMSMTLISVQGQNSSCGEPMREHAIDTDGDGMNDDTVKFEKCFIRDFQYDGTAKKIIVHYTIANGRVSDRLRDVDMNGDGTNDITSEGIAEKIAIYTQEAWEAFRDYGNPDPMGRNDMNVLVMDMRGGLLGWCCTSDRYSIDAPHVIGSMENDTLDAMATCFHEMWHASRWRSGAGGWINEGSASNMTDHVNLSLDNDNSNDYIGRVQGYLGSSYRNAISENNYNAALWWKYFMERVGTTTTEPNRGVDAMTKFWDNWSSDGHTTFDNVIKANLSGQDLASLWLDFTVANYAKEYTGVPSKYQFIDENQTNSPDYREPGNLALNLALNNADGGVTNITSIKPWSSQYLKIRPANSVPILNFDIHQDTDNKVAYTLLLIKGGALVKEIQRKSRSFVHAEINDDYDEAVLCITSFSEFINYRYSINSVNPVVNIISPLRGQPVWAGDAASPEKILVKVEVLSPLGGGRPLEGLAVSDFDIEIGGVQVPDSNFITSAYLQGQYWFVLRPPVQLNNGLKNLEIGVNGIAVNDIERNSVDFSPLGAFDNIIVGDRSGSMGDFNKLIAAEDAARLYVDSWKSGDKISVVSFNENATVDMTLRNWNSSSRMKAFEEINDWTHGGNTAIGDGLLAGLGEFTSRGDTSHDWTMVVLSDGIETADKRVKDFLTEFNERRDKGDKNPTVHTVALGPDSDRANMQKLASETGGTYHFASEPGPAPASFNLLAQPLIAKPNNINNELAEIYRVISEEISTEQQIYSSYGALSNVKQDIHNIVVDPGASEATFTVNWYPNAPDSVFLYDPDNIEILPTNKDNTHNVYKVNSPKAGIWKVSLQCNPIVVFSSANASCSNYLVEAALKSQLTADLYFGNSLDTRNIGQKMPILVTLTDENPILNATVLANITKPNQGSRNIVLYDDGNHKDGEENDGIYGNVFHQTAIEGTYITKVDITGTSNTGNNFKRRLSGAFDMKRTQDEDGDGMPDDWEVLVGLDKNTNDENGDNDNDGISNIVEFLAGLNPNNSDSDNGGEDDGSEIANGGDPLNPLDDKIMCMLNFSIQNYLEGHGHGDYHNLNAAILNFSVHPSYHHMIIWRKEKGTANWIVIDSNAAANGQYIDSSVVLGKTYLYKIQAVDNAGRKSCIRGPREVTPKEDPIPPIGILVINNWAESTKSLNVSLYIEASTDASEMRISNTGNFENANWISFQQNINWNIDPNTNPNSIARVYAQVRDVNGNISDVFLDGIKYEQKNNIWCYIMWFILILLLIVIIIFLLKKLR